MKKISLLLMTLLLIWMGFIFHMSNTDSSKSSAQSDKIVSFIAKVVIKQPKLIEDQKFANDISHNVRKSAHAFLYFFLGLLSSATLVSILRRCIFIETFTISVVFCQLYAASDELHQLFVGRGAALSDIAIDFCASIPGVLITILIITAFPKIYEIISK